MKKTLIALCATLACAVVFAQDAAPAPAPVVTKAPDTSAPWPVWLAFNSTKNIDVVGLRFTLPYGECESVTGFDLGSTVGAATSRACRPTFSATTPLT